MANHPVLEGLRAAHAALDAISVRDEAGRSAGWMSMADMEPRELREAVRLQAELEGRIAGLRLHAVAAADAGDAAGDAAATDTSSWAASAGKNRSRSWGGVWLANLLESKYAATRAALAAGSISEEHASVIVRAAERVPVEVAPKDLADCEERLVGKAARMSPQALRRAARRLLDPLSKQLADAHEDKLLTEQERKAELYTGLVMGDNGDGTWTGKFVIPELHAHVLKTVLESLSGPRRYGRTRTGERVEDPTLDGRLNLSSTERLGAALCEVIEHLPLTGHARSAVTLVVHVDEETLRNQVGAATLGTGIETGSRISHEQLRPLACEAGIMPMVMGGKSLPLDMGMASRLFTLHHRLPWSQGGPTDLDNAAPLCGYHHRRVHDARYEHEWLPDGSVRFRHRWRSRWPAGTDPWQGSPGTAGSVRTDAA